MYKSDIQCSSGSRNAVESDITIICSSRNARLSSKLICRFGQSPVSMMMSHTHRSVSPTDCQCMHGTDITVLQARAWLARLTTLSSYFESQNTTQEETRNNMTNSFTKFCWVQLGTLLWLDSLSPVSWDCDCGRWLALWRCRLWLGRCWLVVNLRFGAAGAHFSV